MENTTMNKCAYCGKERPMEEMKQGVITFRNSKYDSRGKRKQFVDKKTNWYCNDTSCHGNDQMAHEG